MAVIVVAYPDAVLRIVLGSDLFLVGGEFVYAWIPEILAYGAKTFGAGGVGKWPFVPGPDNGEIFINAATH